MQYEPMANLMSQWIETVTQKTIDVSDFSERYVDQYAPSILKMFKLNIISSFNEISIENDAEISKSTGIQSILSFSTYLETAVYKNDKDLFTGADLERYYEYMNIAYGDDSKNKEQWIDSDELLNQLNIAETDGITKKIFADFFVLMREATVGLVENAQLYEPTIPLEDDSDPAVRVLLILNVYRPGQMLTVRPDHPFTYAEFTVLLNRSLPYWNAFDKEDFISNEEVAELLVAIYEKSMDWEQQIKIESEIDSDVDYEWYVSQLDTGEYTLVNSFPASIAMIGRWFDESFNETVQDIRKKNMKDGEAWTMAETENQLKEYGIKYARKEPSIDAIIQTIDKGGVALVAIDTQIVGHAVIVKGYERRGDDIYLHIYDPAVGDTPDEYGQPMGAHVIEHTTIFDYKMQQRNENILIFSK
jgi:hypothetical protein